MRPAQRNGKAAGAVAVADGHRGVIYARVSSKDQEREGFSIPAQLQLLRGYAASRGLKVLKEFVDVETAKQAGRTGFGEMLAFLRKEKSCRILLVEKTDRRYRNLKDWVTLDELTDQPWESRRLQEVRTWSHGDDEREDKYVLAIGERPGGADGV